MGIFDLFKKNKKKNEIQQSFKNITLNEEKPIIIKLSQENAYSKLIINDYYTIQDYVNKMKEIDKLGIDKLLNLSILWNSERQMINKGTYYIFSLNERLYNILINDEMIAIDERTPIGEHILNKVIKFTLNDNLFSYFRCKHDENGSSYDTRYYSPKGALIMELSKMEFNDDFNSIISNLKDFKDIEKIIEVNKIKRLVREQNQEINDTDENTLTR